MFNKNEKKVLIDLLFDLINSDQIECYNPKTIDSLFKNKASPLMRSFHSHRNVDENSSEGFLNREIVKIAQCQYI